MPFHVRAGAKVQGVLRLRKNFASRSSYSAQDDSSFILHGFPRNTCALSCTTAELSSRAELDHSLANDPAQSKDPIDSMSVAALQGILSVLPLSKCLSTSMLVQRYKGSFDSVKTSLREVLAPLRTTKRSQATIDSPSDCSGPNNRKNLCPSSAHTSPPLPSASATEARRTAAL
jgi:hypothetical protein